MSSVASHSTVLDTNVCDRGLPCPVNDILVVNEGRVVSAGMSGEVWL